MNLKFITVCFVLMLLCNALQAQSFGEKLGKTIKKSAENSTLRKAEQKTDQAVSKSIDKATDPNSYKKNKKSNDKKQDKNAPNDNAEINNQSNSEANDNADSNNTTAAKDKEEPKPAVKSPEMAYNKFDFVAGDEIIFEDDVAGEQMGEFPSKWDLMEGEAEIAKFNGENVIVMKKGCYIRPLMKEIKNYLGDVYTIEFDYWFTLAEEGKHRNGNFWIGLKPEDVPWASSSNFHLDLPGNVVYWVWNRSNPAERTVNFSYAWQTPDKENRSGNREEYIEAGTWVHISLSFNKRAMKIYVNENRVANIPNMAADNDWFSFYYGSGDDDCHGYVKNFRIAKGAVPLYDRMMTDGKIITYGITFDIGKATIKPESMGEINRIVTLMTENPDLKFSVEGHTDNTGNAATNQTLSEERSQAVMNKMIELGISKDRLSAAGKGQNSPIADNTTDEGRAKNRRVEFVKTN